MIIFHKVFKREADQVFGWHSQNAIYNYVSYVCENIERTFTHNFEAVFNLDN